MSLLVHSRNAQADRSIGGKAGALAELTRAGFPVPDWFVVTTEAFQASLTKSQDRAFCGARSVEELGEILQSVRPAESLVREIEDALSGPGFANQRVAVRSSASDEDGTQHSFAGQLESYLFVAAGDVVSKVVSVWRSGFSERILAYRLENGLPLVPNPPAVLVQLMVDSDASGVAFAADPVSGRHSLAVVSALYGLGTGLVSGDCAADTWHVDRSRRIVHREIAHKLHRHRMDAGSEEGVSRSTVEESLRGQPSLRDEEVLEAADLVRQTSRHFGRPQDIEFAFSQGRIHLLQSRPITTLSNLADPDGAPIIWDNSNITESYSGVTTPLTFSFARHAYEGVYREFCRILQVPASRIEASDPVFRRMLGLIQGRIYYNLLNWYRVLALLPGFQVNRRFMEQMMGVRESLPEDIVLRLDSSNWSDRLSDSLNLARSVAGLLLNHLLLGRKIRKFYERLDQTLLPPDPPLSEMRPDELTAYYERLEMNLLRHWDAPLINDFLAMIFYGVLGKVADKWCGDGGKTVQNDLLCGQGGMLSAEPAHRVQRMAALARPDEELVHILCEGTRDEVVEQIGRRPEFEKEYRSYLDKFGDRCMEELKLESNTLHDDPMLLIRSVGHLARRESGEKGGAVPAGNSTSDTCRNAEARVRSRLAGHPIRRLLFRWILRNTRARVRDRENLRFERTRVFGRVRRVFVEMGKRFHAADLLDHPRDIFYLQVEEILGFVHGTATTLRLRDLCALRKQEFEGFRKSPPPPGRLETRGAVYSGNSFREKTAMAESIPGESLTGTGCCPGRVRGRIKVVVDPKDSGLRPGWILATRQTDPGWILLFPMAAGVLVERGSLLSHAAIVSRELGIPSIVGLQGLLEWVKDGEWVEMDGASGIVHRIATPGEGQTDGK